MKYMYMAMLMMSLSSNHVSSADYYQSLCASISSMGQAIEDVNNVPVVGKLTNILPFAALASSLKECPMQTLAVLMVLGSYVLSDNHAVRRMIEKYEFTNRAPWIRRKRAIIEPTIDDSFFMYDEDEEENELIEDDLLNSDLFDSEDDQTKQRKKYSPEQSLS